MLWLMMMMACGKSTECPNGLEYYEGFCLTPLGEGDDPWLDPGGSTTSDDTGDTGDTSDTGDTGDTGVRDTGDTSDTGDTGDTGGA